MTWPEAIDAAIIGTLTPQQKFFCALNAGTWEKCPTQDVTGVDRWPSGMPKDEGLKELGKKFARDIRFHEWHVAKFTLDEIQRWGQ